MIAETMRRKPRPAMPGTLTDTNSMIRVDHAGEFGAVRIYAGQLAVLKNRAGTKASVETITHMAEQEQGHLKAFDRLVNERGVRPTMLAPIWHVAGFALGAATAAMGEKAAFACTAAVEEVIDDHYAKQITALGKRDPELAGAVAKFRADEIAHRNTALENGAQDAAGYPWLSGAIKAGCRIAIRLSERI